jgi:hypothetical protein
VIEMVEARTRLGAEALEIIPGELMRLARGMSRAIARSRPSEGVEPEACVGKEMKPIGGIFAAGKVARFSKAFPVSSGRVSPAPAWQHSCSLGVRR